MNQDTLREDRLIQEKLAHNAGYFRGLAKALKKRLRNYRDPVSHEQIATWFDVALQEYEDLNEASHQNIRKLKTELV